MHDRLMPGRFLKRTVRIVVILLLAAVIAFLFMSRSRRLVSPHCISYCGDNLRQIGLALKQYAQDHDEVFPPDLKMLYPRYAESRKTLVCPLDRAAPRGARSGDPNAPWYTSYTYVSGLTDLDRSACVLAYERQENHRREGMAWWQPGVRLGVNVLFLDTHVEWVPDPEQLAELLAKTRELAAANGHEVKLVGE